MTEILTKFSNVTLVRAEDGTLSVWVAGEKMLGAQGIAVHPNGVLALGVDMARVRFAEEKPIVTLVYESVPDNVVYPTFRNTGDLVPPPTDGDSA